MKNDKKMILFFTTLFLFFIIFPIIEELKAGEELLITLKGAVLETLENNVNILIQKEQIEKSKASLQTTDGKFDWMIKNQVSWQEKKTPLGNDLITTPEEQSTAYSLSLAKQMRNGIKVITSASAQEIKNNSDMKDPKNYSDVKTEIIIPLLKGLGEKSANYEGLAAKASLNATQQLVKYEISKWIFSTVSQFWSTLIAQRSFELSQDTHNRSKELFNRVQRLISAGDVEPAFLSQASANLLISETDIINGKLSLYKSKQNLALAMGYDKEKLAKTPTVVDEPLNVININSIRQDALSVLINDAVKFRGDYLASLMDIEKEKILLYKAKDDLRLRFDLDLFLGYVGLDKSNDESRYIKSFSNNITGPKIEASFNLEIPVINRTAIGNVSYRKSFFKESELKSKDLSNIITSQVMTVMESFKSSINEYKLVLQSEAAYANAVEFENRKYQSGESTLNNVIDLEDRYFKARISKLEAIRKYAVALAELRFVTGTILKEKDNNLIFQIENITKF